MTRGLGMDASGAWYDDVAVGDTFSRTVTVTDTHLVLGAGLIGDFNPHHVDDEYAKGTRFGTRILHGMLTSALMGAPGRHVLPRHRDRLSRAHRALQGAGARRRHAARPGGQSPRATTSRSTAAAWSSCAAYCRNQDDVVVAEADGKILVRARRAASA